MGVDVEKIDPMNNRATVKNGSGTFTVQVHGRTNNDKWQISLSMADKADGDRAWIFVSFDGDGTDTFYIVGGWWLKGEVRSGFRDAYPDGHRVKNDDSDHWQIDTNVVAKYRDRWDLITG